MSPAIQQTPPFLPAERRDHNGGMVDFNQVFFQEPPTEIGRVFSSHSTLRSGQKSWRWLRFLLSPLIALPLVACGVWLYRYDLDNPGIGIGIFIFGLAVFAYTYARFRFKSYCTYVGADGVARFTIKDSLQAKPVTEIFLFEKAASLRVRNTKINSQGWYMRPRFPSIYSHTRYAYTWYDKSDRPVFKLTGLHTSQANTPETDNLYWCALAAETAWTRRLKQSASAPETSG